MTRVLRIVVAALVFVAAPLLAQQKDSLPNDSSDVLVLDHDFTGPGEFARAVLTKFEVYRAELSTDDAVIQVYPIKGGQPVFINREQTPSPSGGGLYTLYPTETKEYQFRLVSGGPVTRLRVYRDVKRSQRRQKLRDEPGWEIGGEIAVGGHSGYKLNTEREGVTDSDEGGIDIEGCFSARSGPGALNYVSGCAFGAGYDQRNGSRSTAWFFIEPRIRLFGGKERGISNNEVGVLGRLSLGFISGVNRNPQMATLGVYATRNIRWNKAGKGLSFTLAYRRGWIGNLGETEDFRPYGKKKTDRVSIGIGYYQ